MSKATRHTLAFLRHYEPDSSTLQYAHHLLAGENRLIPSVRDQPSIESIALYGLDDDEWLDAVRAVRLQVKLDQLSPRFPLVTLSDEPIESESGRIQLWGQRTLRPSVLEDRLGIPIETIDMQVLMDAVMMLPPSWSAVLEIPRGTG
ncbi:hypothetical protein [Vreelandella massiliensis]|uniref:hypothetical protein n=1 Tax=Vreelandella massiliensis TaxID=1816686 RepID=UPI00096A84D0|nr:hypothetical protein [Halomonas massiliensis]